MAAKSRWKILSKALKVNYSLLNDSFISLVKTATVACTLQIRSLSGKVMDLNLGQVISKDVKNGFTAVMSGARNK